MTNESLGQLAALGTAFCWAGSAIAFEVAGRRVGSLPVNLLRLLVALVFFAIWGLWHRGHMWPVGASLHAWTWLGVSGLIGFCFGDLCLFRAFLLIGARLSSLLMSTAPVFTAVIGWLILGETLTAIDLVGIALVTIGVAWAVSQRQVPALETGRPPGELAKGILLGLGGALGQALGLVVSKVGMGEGFDPVSATQIRVVAGVVGFAVLFAFAGVWPRVWSALRDQRAMASLSAGAFMGPFVGVSLSLYAISHTATGIAATLMALTPLVIIPIAVITKGERVGVAGVGGAAVAVVGAWLLFA